VVALGGAAPHPVPVVSQFFSLVFGDEHIKDHPTAELLGSVPGQLFTGRIEISDPGVFVEYEYDRVNNLEKGLSNR
jgi:hypothetical protein